MTNPDNNDPNPSTDSGTPVQDYVGPQAEVTLPPWRPAPLVQHKQDDSFSEAEMRAIGKEVDARRSANFHGVIFCVLAVPYFALLAFRGFNSSLVLFEVGWATWLAVHGAPLFRQNALVGEIRLRHLVSENNAMLGLPSTEGAPFIEEAPYMRRFRLSLFLYAGLIALTLLAALLGIFLDMGGFLALGLGLTCGLIMEYLTLCRGLGRLNETERQRKIDELMSKW
jgi:hypothetical protein